MQGGGGLCSLWSFGAVTIYSHKKSRRPGGFSHRIYSLMVMEPQSPRSRVSRVAFYWGPASWLVDGWLFPVSAPSLLSGHVGGLISSSLAHGACWSMAHLHDLTLTSSGETLFPNVAPF